MGPRRETLAGQTRLTRQGRGSLSQSPSMRFSKKTFLFSGPDAPFPTVGGTSHFLWEETAHQREPPDTKFPMQPFTSAFLRDKKLKLCPVSGLRCICWASSLSSMRKRSLKVFHVRQAKEDRWIREGRRSPSSSQLSSGYCNCLLIGLFVLRYVLFVTEYLSELESSMVLAAMRILGLCGSGIPLFNKLCW